MRPYIGPNVSSQNRHSFMTLGFGVNQRELISLCLKSRHLAVGRGCKLGLVDPNLPLMASLPADSLEEDALLGVSRLKQPVDICMAIATALSGSCRPLFLSENTSKLLRLSCLKLSAFCTMPSQAMNAAISGAARRNHQPSQSFPVTLYITYTIYILYHIIQQYNAYLLAWAWGGDGTF